MTENFTYDTADRLTSVSGTNAPDISWTYDPVGNRLTETRGQTTTDYTYNAADELTQAGSDTYSYDDNGNELTDGTRTFTYNAANELTSATSGGDTTTYTYDGDGNRLQATSTSATTKYLWDTSGGLPQLALEKTGSGSLIRRYLYGASRISMTTPTGTFYYHYDTLGSVADLTSSSGASEWAYAYDPFGGIFTQTQNDPTAPANPMLFTAELQDSTGLYDLRARAYDPTSGRFVQVDPAGNSFGLGASLYIYGGSRPTVMVDPTGQSVEFANIGQGSAQATVSAGPGFQWPDLYALAVRFLLVLEIQWTEHHLSDVPGYVSGGGRPIDLQHYPTLLRFPPTDCSGFVTLLYLWASSGDPKFDPNNRAFAGGESDAYTGNMATASNGRTVYYASSAYAHGYGSKRNTRAGDIVVWGPTGPTAHVAIFADDWTGDSTMVLSHGGPAGAHPHWLPFSAVDANHKSQARWFRTYFP